MANSRVFKANSDGWCGDCDLPIERNDQVCYNEDDELIHADCRGTMEAGKPKTCPDCNTTLPRSGVCGYC